MKVAALDIGLKRIGVALSLDGKSAIPQNAILRKNRNQAAREVSEFLKAWEIDTLVVGLPIGGSSEEEMKRRFTHFISLLSFEGSVHFQDESGSSEEAKDRMTGVTKQKRDGRIDSIAAQIILERWLGCL